MRCDIQTRQTTVARQILFVDSLDWDGVRHGPPLGKDSYVAVQINQGNRLTVNPLWARSI